MKKNLFIPFFLLLSFSNYIQAQDYVRYNENANVYTGIIRSTPYYNPVACYSKDNSSGYIELRSQGLHTTRVKVPLEYDVKDMKVFNNLIYFCGQHFNKGFVGIVNLYHLFNTLPQSTNTAGVSFLDFNEDEITSLEKLVVFNDNSSIFTYDLADENVVAIGRIGNQSQNSQWKVVHLKYNNHHIYNGFLNEISYVNVKIISDITSPSNEEIQEVILTDDYVALLSYRNSSDEYILRRCSKNNISGTFNTIYKYQTSHFEVLSELKAVALDGNNIALATLSADDVSLGTFEIIIRNIDLNTMNMVASQAIPIGEQMNDVEIAYNKIKQRIVIMTNYRFHNWNYDFASFFEMNPWANTTEMVWAIYDLNQRFYTSIDYAYGPYYVAVSDNVWFFKALPNNVQNPICYSTFSLGLDPISLLSFGSNSIQSTVIESRVPTIGQVKNIEFINNNLECRND